jgi:uncharacterized membrane protein YgcG
MDDMMLDLTAGNQMLRRRLDAYADARLSPDAAATTRMRARVMAAAHRQAAATAAGAGLTLITSTVPAAPARRSRHPLARAAGVLLSAALGLSVAVGSALAADAGGVLYPARLGLETVLLPTDPSERAIAELARLETRLHEARDASARGDAAGVAAAMGAYASILESATADALRSGDPVATAALEAGVERNIVVLRALLERAPDAATGGLTKAIERSGAVIDDMHGTGGGTSGGGGSSGGGGGGDDPAPTVTEKPKPTKDPATPKPTKAPATPKPTKEPTAEPTPKPTAEPTPRAERTPRADRTPPGQPPDAPGQQGNDASGGD